MYTHTYMYAVKPLTGAKGGVSCSKYIDTRCSIYMYTISLIRDTYIIYTCKYLYVLKPLSGRKAVCCVVYAFIQCQWIHIIHILL